MTIKHDPLYKELIQNLFKDFMQFAFEEIYKHIDYKTVKFLDKEVHDIFEGIDRRLDVFAEANIRGKKEIIYIHVEIESSRQKEFPFRMWEYFSLIHRKFGKPVIPIALFVDDKKWTEMLPDKYEVSFMGHQFLSFNYKQIKLKNFKVTDYINSRNPIVQVLLAKMDLSEVDAKKIKLSILRYLFQTKKNIGKKRSMLYNFIETYFTLPQKDEEEIKSKIIKESPEANMLIETYFDKIEAKARKKYLKEGLEKGMEKGMEKGIEKGIEKGLEKGLEIGREEGELLAAVKSTKSIIEDKQFELEKLKDYFETKKLPSSLYKVMSAEIKKKIEQEKKELRLLKNKLKNFK